MTRMDKTLYTCIGLLMILSVACTPSKWTRKNTALQVAFAATLVVDYWQTAQPDGIVDRCDEWNPLVGQCGERAGALGALLLTGALHAAIATSLSDDWRTAFQGISLGVESHQIWTNYQMGYGMLGMGRIE